MKIQIIKHYAPSDTKFLGESVTDLIVDGNVVFQGEDSYHDKINHKIEGFLTALVHLRIDFEIEKQSIADCQLLEE